MFVASGIGPYSGQSRALPAASRRSRCPIAVNRYRREAERHYRVLDKHLAGRDVIVGNDYSIVDMSAWGWIDRAPRGSTR